MTIMDSNTTTATTTEHAISTTTAEQDRHTSGQRRVNIIWESTQASIAIGVTGATLLVLSTRGAIPAELSNAFFLVVGFYFGRTNHQRLGDATVDR